MFTTTTSPLVLVTGATGFLAQHVVAAVLKSGYRVRGTIRDSSKADALLQKFPENFETAVVADIATSDLTGAMKDITFVLHTASPFTMDFRNGEEELLQPAINGLNVLRAAKNASVQKTATTSSFAAIDWNPATYEEAAKPGQHPLYVYAASKKLAEEAAWRYARENQLNLVALNPPMIYGPALQESATSPKTLNTSSAGIYQLFSGALQVMPDDGLPQFVDVRDVATAHVLALQTAGADGMRVPLCGGAFLWSQAVEVLLKTRPELTDRLVALNPGNTPPGPIAALSTKVARENLGIQDYITWEKSLVDTVDSLLALEKKWKVSS